MRHTRRFVSAPSLRNTPNPIIEAMEGRQLLSVALTSGVLTITGTGSADTYSLTASGANIVVVENGGGPQNFVAANVNTIVANLGGGGDNLFISDDITQRATLNGEAGNDTLDGGGGDDVIDGGIGNDSIDGGAGNDTVSYASRSEAITGTLGIDYTFVASGEAPLIVYSGTAGATGEADTFVAVETLAGGSGNDTLSDTIEVYRSSSAPGHTLSIFGNGGDDTLNISGGGGNFYEFGGDVGSNLPSFPYVIANGGDGNDNIVFGGTTFGGGTALFGGDGDDHFTSPSGDKAYFVAGDGFDTLEVDMTDYGKYEMPNDLEKVIVTGASLPLEITGREANDDIELQSVSSVTIHALGGNDLIRDVNNSADSLIVYCGDGNDTVYAGIGDDRVYGEGGDDRLNGDGGKDSLYGGDGDDRIYGNSGSDRLFGDAGVDRLYGGNKNDYLDGGAGADYIKGDEDTDTAKPDKKDRRYEDVEIFV